MNQITLMMLDKPYYDYDYEHVSPKPKKSDVKKARERMRGYFKHTKFQGAKAGDAEKKVESEIDIAERLQREAQEQLARRGKTIK